MNDATDTVLPSCQIQITQALIDEYAHLSGDFNPVHVDPQAAAGSSFGTTIAHGCIPLEPVFQSLLRWSGLQSLPPQTRFRLRYRAPSRPGDTIRSQVQLISRKPGQVQLSFACLNQLDQLVIDGDCDFPL
ncbi:MAG: MaoC family dehydratase [Betaproteobacteria bacterium]